MTRQAVKASPGRHRPYTGCPGCSPFTLHPSSSLSILYLSFSFPSLCWPTLPKSTLINSLSTISPHVVIAPSRPFTVAAPGLSSSGHTFIVDCAVVLLALRLVPVPDLRPPSISISDPSFVSLTWTGLPFKLPFQRCFVFVLDILFLRSLIQSPSSLYGNSNDSVVCLPSFIVLLPLTSLPIANHRKRQHPDALRFTTPTTTTYLGQQHAKNPIEVSTALFGR